MADEDDLDAFFDEVSEVEAKAVEEEKEEKTEIHVSPASAVAGNGEEGAAEAAGEKTSEPPAKRHKTSVAVRPKGVVVASSTSVILHEKEREEKAAEAELKAQQQQQYQHQQQQIHHPPIHCQPSMMPMGPAGPRVGPSPMGNSIGPIFAPFNAHSSTTDPSVDATTASQLNAKKKPIVRMAAGQKWIDPSLEEWPENDYRIFVGNLSNEVTDVQLHQHFSKYPSLAKAKVVRQNNNPDKSKGYGFVSLLDPLECARAIREMDQTWLCSRPIRVKRSDWKERDFKQVKKKQKKEMKQQKRMVSHF